LPRCQAVIPLQENRYAHGGAELAVQHHGGEPVPAFDLVENSDDPIAFLDVPAGRVEEEDDALQIRFIPAHRCAQVVRHAGHDGSRPLDLEPAVRFVELERHPRRLLIFRRYRISGCETRDEGEGYDCAAKDRITSERAKPGEG
jgi:hypothetical protein